MLAEISASPSPQALKQWLEVFLYLGGIILTAAGVWRLVSPSAAKTEIVDQPLEIKAHAGIATREELKQVHGRIERERREVDAAILSVAHTAEKRADKTDAKLDENTAMTQRMSGEVSQINQSVQTLTSSLTNFLQHQARK